MKLSKDYPKFDFLEVLYMEYDIVLTWIELTDDQTVKSIHFEDISTGEHVCAINPVDKTITFPGIPSGKIKDTISYHYDVVGFLLKNADLWTTIHPSLDAIGEQKLDFNRISKNKIVFVYSEKVHKEEE